MGREIDRLLSSLQRDSSLKAWSLIVTFIGDAIVTRGGNVSAKTVQTVLAEMGIGAGTVRTAFSRLANDHWIVRHKIGRESFYELAAEGYEPFKNASDRIYSPSSACDSVGWTIAVKNPAAKLPASSLLETGLQVSANCWLFSRITSQLVQDLKAAGFMLLSGTMEDLPEWVSDKWLTSELAAGYQQLEQRFSTIECADKLEPLDSLVIRCLLIHQWRRLLLRTPELPSALLPKNWPEARCRALVSGLYQQLLPGSENWLNESATCTDGALPKPQSDIRLRFTNDYKIQHQDKTKQ